VYESRVKKKPAKKATKPAAKKAANKAAPRPRKTAAERREEEMRWYQHHTSYNALYNDIYSDYYEEARDRMFGKLGHSPPLRTVEANMPSDKEMCEESKSDALREWLQCKSVEEMQAAIDNTAVPMPASIKKQAKERINVLQDEAARGIERARPAMRETVREQRHAELSQALRQRHPDLQIRSDSAMCDSYLKLMERDDARLEEVTNVMHEMWFLFNHTDYNRMQNERCSKARDKRDQKRDRLKFWGLGRDYEFGWPDGSDWIDYNMIKERAKRDAVAEYIKRVGRDNLPDYFPPTMRSWGQR
jgi:hypothetical protein